MDKLAAEKIAHEYFQVGVELALQDAGLGMNKTASRGKDIAKMLGLGGAGALGGAALAKMLTPQAERAAIQLADMAPGQFVDEIGAAAKSRLAMTDAVTKKMLQNADLNDMDRYERVAATIQALKPSNLRDMTMTGPDGSKIGKLEALNYLNPFADQNVYSMDTLRGMGLVD